MQKTSEYCRAVEYLNYLFDLLNKDFFGGALQKPTITIQSTPEAYGHFTPKKNTWVGIESGDTHEINIGAGTLARPIVLTVTTLIHEMVHYRNFENGIIDCTKGGKYHNKSFRDAAESYGLVVSKSKNYGWSITKPGPAIYEFVRKYSLSDIQIYRNEAEGKTTKPAKSSTRKYVCPVCGMSVRATKNVNISCIDCGNRKMVLEPKKAG